MEAIVYIVLQIFFAARAVLKIGEYLVNKPLQAAGMSADNVHGWEIVRKMNIWPRSIGVRAGGARRDAAPPVTEIFENFWAKRWWLGQKYSGENTLKGSQSQTEGYFL